MTEQTTTAMISDGTWTVQEARAEFRARNFGWHVVTGTIAVVAGVIEVDADRRSATIHATLDPASIDTGNARRDKDVCGKRFLKVTANPAMTVDASEVVETDGGWRCAALVGVAGATAPVTLRVELEPASTEAYPRLKATGQLDLRAVGITVPPFMVRRFVDLVVTVRLGR